MKRQYRDWIDWSKCGHEGAGCDCRTPTQRQGPFFHSRPRGYNWPPFKGGSLKTISKRVKAVLGCGGRQSTSQSPVSQSGKSPAVSHSREQGTLN